MNTATENTKLFKTRPYVRLSDNRHLFKPGALVCCTHNNGDLAAAYPGVSLIGNRLSFAIGKFKDTSHVDGWMINEEPIIVDHATQMTFQEGVMAIFGTPKPDKGESLYRTLTKFEV